MKIEIISEGQTEEKVCSKIVKILNIENLVPLDPDFKKKPNAESGGKDKLNELIRTKLREILKEQTVNFLILRDLDSHDGETEASILQSLTGVLQSFFAEREIQTTVNLLPHSIYPNIYMLEIIDLDFRLSLHIATKKWKKDFIKSTIDDYVLELALRQATINKLATKISIPPKRISAKITQEIPDLLKANADGQNDLVEAKDYVRLYAAILKLHTSPAVFAQKVMANANEEDIRDVFAALISAFEFVSSSPQA
ncbi:hypothetical protein K4A83_00500 [Spirulina subsalsa FACHB-351]|uniref:DUF4276 family protein n=1 Tax=Spirulina subsalsa FACHB-351 TaxID=234711 RepID=A0ABT3KZT9_9CYAN|nr:hypothetical protein [Spirulina subsalsa]MCW6034757.1 hypothetical protein [Spirulina subsalsa FACHB-351]